MLMTARKLRGCSRFQFSFYFGSNGPTYVAHFPQPTGYCRLFFRRHQLVVSAIDRTGGLFWTDNLQD
jgi:hypothetical protein